MKDTILYLCVPIIPHLTVIRPRILVVGNSKLLTELCKSRPRSIGTQESCILSRKGMARLNSSCSKSWFANNSVSNGESVRIYRKVGCNEKVAIGHISMVHRTTIIAFMVNNAVFTTSEQPKTNFCGLKTVNMTHNDHEIQKFWDEVRTINNHKDLLDHAKLSKIILPFIYIAGRNSGFVLKLQSHIEETFPNQQDSYNSIETM